MAKFGKVGAVALTVGALTVGAALAQPYSGYAPQPQRPYAPPPYAVPRACCLLPAGSALAVELTQAVGTKEAKAGDIFPLRLAAPVIVDRQVVLPAGVPGIGHVVQASRPGPGGKGAKLVLAADYLTTPAGNVPLQGMQLTGSGKDHSFAADMASMGGWLYMPLSLVGFVVTGGDIEIPAGVNAAAKTARAMDLGAIADAGAQDYDKVRAVFGDPQASQGKKPIERPPAGYGQVVFFRAQQVGAFDWFNVRENDAAMGKLTAGAYFVAPMKPGTHTFSASSEPEFKDHLTLKVDAGETYYVEGVMTHGLFIGVADLTPSDKARFDALSGQLGRAPLPGVASAHG